MCSLFRQELFSMNKSMQKQFQQVFSFMNVDCFDGLDLGLGLDNGLGLSFNIVTRLCHKTLQ